MAITPVRLRKVITGTKQKYFDLDVLDAEGNIVGRRLYIANIEKNSNNVKEILELGENTPPSQLTNTCNIFSSAGGVKDLVIRNMFEVTENPDFETRSYAYANKNDLEFNKADDYSDLFIDNRYQVSSIIGFNDSVFTLTNPLSSVTYYPLDYITEYNTLSTVTIRDPLFTAVFDDASALENLSPSEFDKKFVPKYLINGLRYNNVIDYPMSVYPLFKDNTLLGNAIICKNHLGYDYSQHSVETQLGEGLATREFTEMRSYKRLISSGDNVYLVYDNTYYIDDPNRTVETVPYINNTDNTGIIVNIINTEEYDPSFPFNDIIQIDPDIPSPGPINPEPEPDPDVPDPEPEPDPDVPGPEPEPDPDVPDPKPEPSINYTIVKYQGGSTKSFLIKGTIKGTNLSPTSQIDRLQYAKEIIIGKAVTSIGRNAFLNCANLTSITIPESVTEIGDYAFRKCSNLTTVTIQDGLISIGDYAFDRCWQMTSIEIPQSVVSIGKEAFYSCGGLTTITIPSSVTEIGDSAFYGCYGLKEVTIQEGVTEIGDSMFSYCSRLTSVAIPSSVSNIGYGAFQNCESLKEVTIQEGVTKIGQYMFDGCEYLNSITLPSTVIEIENGAFYDCDSLTSITIPEAVTEIGSYAFFDCSNLKDIIFLGPPPTVTDSLTFKTYRVGSTGGYYTPEYAQQWQNGLGGKSEGYFYPLLYVKPLDTAATYSLRSSRSINTRDIKPVLDLNKIEKVEMFNSVNRFTQANHHKSNLYSIEIEDLGLNAIEKTADEKIKIAVKNIKKSITNNIKKICQNTQPGNTQLFSVFFTGN